VFAGVGERTREGNDLYREMIESGVIKLGEKQVSGILFMTLSAASITLLSILLTCQLWLHHYIRVKANVLLCTVK